VDATVVLLDAGIVELDAGVVLDAGTVPWVVPAVTPAVRSITPTLGATSDPALADAAAEPLDPASEAHAARPNVTRVHNTTVPMCERAAKAGFLIDHYPGCVKHSPGQRSRERTTLRRRRDPNDDTHCWVAGNPAISGLLQLETGGFASPPCGGFALALWASKPD
jgi:hypothetical protein